MKKRTHFKFVSRRNKSFLRYLLPLIILLLSVNGLMAQQVIGTFPTMDGGFEGQAVGALPSVTIASGMQTTIWTANSTGIGTINANTPRTGLKYMNATTTSTSKRWQSPTVGSGAITNVQYTVQYYYRTTGATGTSASMQIGASPDGTGSPTYFPSAAAYTTLAGTNNSWQKFSAQVTVSTAGGAGKYGIGIIRCNTPTMGVPIDVDDFVMYAGTADNTVPDPVTSPSVTAPAGAQQTVSWTAPGTGIDGGGYMVVRGLSDPTTAPNINGIYQVGNTVASGQQVVYLGTNPSFIDNGLTPLTHYYYRIYTVDKAFNYSSSVAIDGSTTVTSLSTEPTAQVTNLNFTSVSTTGFTVNWTPAVSGGGTNHLVVVKPFAQISNDPADGSSYGANTTLGAGYTVGGGYVVYNGTGNSVAVTGLSKGVSYFVKVYDFNGSAGSENYLTASPAAAVQDIAGSISSNATGLWSATTTWLGGVVPTSTDNVTILNGHTVTIDGTPSCFNLTINTGGRAYVNSVTQTPLGVYGSSIAVDGTLGDKIDATNESATTINFFGNCTLKGSGTIRPSKIYPGIANASFTFDSNSDVTMTYSAGGIIADYNSYTDGCTININAGRTVNVLGNFNTTSSTGTNATINSTFNINGTVNVTGSFSPIVATGKTCTVNVNGTLNTAILRATSVTGGVAPTINVGSTGMINVTGTAYFTDPVLSATITGAGTYKQSANSTMQIAAVSGLDATSGPIRTTTRTFDSAANYTFLGTSAQSTGSDLPSTIGSLTLNNAAGLTLNAATTVNGALTLTSGNLSTGANTLTLNGTTSGTGLIDAGTSGTVAYGGTLAQTISNLKTNSVNNLTIANTVGATQGAATIVTGATTVNAGALLKTGAFTYTNNGTANINGSFQIDEGGWATGTSDFVYGPASTLVFNNTSGSYGVASTDRYWPYTGGPNSVIVGAGGITLNAWRTVNGLIQTVAGITIPSGQKLTVNGQLQINSGGFIGGISPEFGVASSLIYNVGVGGFNSNLEWPSTLAPFNVEIKNATPVTLSASRTIAGNLTLTSGKLNLGANNLTVGSTSGASATNYVVTDGVGTLTMPVAAAGTVVFPIGTSLPSYDPVSVTPTSLANFSAKVSGTLTGTPASGYNYNAKEWTLSADAPSSTVVTLTPAAVTATGVNSIIGLYDGVSSYVNSTATLTGSTFAGTFATFGKFVTGATDLGTAVSTTKLNGVTFDGQIIHNNANLDLQVYDVSGRNVIRSNQNINMSAHPSGIYIVKATNGTLKITL